MILKRPKGHLLYNRGNIFVYIISPSVIGVFPCLEKKIFVYIILILIKEKLP